ncbi:MAG: pyridoxal phosphate-dependent aminotransferase [Evtepia sp.]
MKSLSCIAEAVQASTTMTIDALYKQMRADGIDVIGFGAGEPDFDTPDHIKNAAVQAIAENKTRYTAASGILELREAVCARMKTDCGLSYTPDEVVISSGAKHNLYAALRTLVNPGDEVLLPAPYWVSYFELIQMVGGVPVVLHTTEASGFKLTETQLRNAITPKTKALILNNPSNPTGMMYDVDSLRMVADVCIQNDLYVIADEIYYSLVYDQRKFVSFISLSPELKERSILINGVSKSYAMTGWRIGYAAASKRIAKVMANYLSHSTSAPSSISQWAAVAALNGPQDGICDMRRAFQERRDYIYEKMNQIPNVSCIKPEGAFYAMMNLDQLIGKTLHGVLIHDADDFATVFLEKGLVAVIPCTGFGADNYVRWSYATSMENIKEGLRRLALFLSEV